MFGLFKKKEAPQGPLVWMIQKVSTDPQPMAGPLFLGVCRDKIVTVSDWKICFRFSDFEAAGLFLYYLIQSGQSKEGSFQVVPVRIPTEAKK